MLSALMSHYRKLSFISHCLELYCPGDYCPFELFQFAEHYAEIARASSGIIAEGLFCGMYDVKTKNGRIVLFCC